MYDSYKSFVYVEAGKYCNSMISIEEIVQKVWLRLCTEEEILQGLSSAKYYSYLSAIVRNTFLSLCRRKMNADYSSCFLDSKNTQVSRESLESPADLSMLCRLMADISGAEKELLERKYILRETDAEIASAMCICDIGEQKLFLGVKKTVLSTLRNKDVGWTTSSHRKK